jgi:nucleotide-binding universal stress UspA family protein
MYHRLLVALEGNDRDPAVVRHAQRLAAHTGAQLTLLRVVAVADDGGGGLGLQFQTEVGSNGWRRRQAAQTALAHLERELAQAGPAVDTALLVSPRPEGEAIVAYAAEHGCDLIIMARDPRPWLQRCLRRAHDDDVLRKATVPTLFVGAPAQRAPVPRPAPQAHPLLAILGGGEL